MGNKWSESLHPRKKGKFVEKAATVDAGRGAGNETNLSLSTSAGTSQQVKDSSADTVRNVSDMHQHVTKAVQRSPQKKSLRYGGRITGAGRRAAVAAVTLAIAVGGLTACSTAPQDQTDSGAVESVDGPGNARLRSFMVETVDGREIPCISLSSGAGRGLSCDWNYNGPSPSAPPR